MCQRSSTETTANGVSTVADNRKEVSSSGNDVKGHPVRMEEFYKLYPSFIWGPCLVAGFLYGLYFIPEVKEYFENNDMKPLGFQAALHYTGFAILASYAFHGWCVTHAPHKLKIQSGKPYEISPNAMAVRSTAALVTELVYTFLPLSPASDSVLKFAMWMAIVAVYWDAHFYCAHRYVHENKAAYRFFHKTHHLCKAPNCFGAYFVTYQSHILLEQVVVFIMAILGMPKDVFYVTMYWGTIGTYIEHAGFELGTMKLPLLPLNLGHLSSLINFSTSWVLAGVNVAEHDWHHEKFFENYSLSFKYLDKIFGTYHPGRVPGEQKMASE